MLSTINNKYNREKFQIHREKSQIHRELFQILSKKHLKISKNYKNDKFTIIYKNNIIPASKPNPIIKPKANKIFIPKVNPKIILNLYNLNNIYNKLINGWASNSNILNNNNRDNHNYRLNKILNKLVNVQCAHSKDRSKMLILFLVPLEMLFLVYLMDMASMDLLYQIPFKKMLKVIFYLFLNLYLIYRYISIRSLRELNSKCFI